MRKTILTLAVAVLACSATFAQEKTKATSGVAQPAALVPDALTQQKRELSKELKDAVMTSDNLIQQTKQAAVGASEADMVNYKAKVEELVGVQRQLSEQLDLVNRATNEDSKTVFTTAREVIASANKSLDAHKSALPDADKKAPEAK